MTPEQAISQPFITVVMPVRNEAGFLAQTLHQLLDQDYPEDRYEIIIADGMSDDGTRGVAEKLAAEFPRIRVLDNPSRLSGAGRNVGFRNGRGLYFLIIDGHCRIPSRSLLTDAARLFMTTGADCLGRPQPLEREGGTQFQKSVALARDSWLGHSGGSLIYSELEGFASPVSNGAAYADHVVEALGGVDESFDAAEDVEFNYRAEKAGFRCYTSPLLTVNYVPRDTLSSLFLQMVRYGKGRGRFVRKHPEALTLNQLVPAAFLIGLCLCFLLLCGHLATRNAVFLAGGAAPCLAYLLLLAVEAARIGIRHGAEHFLRVPLIIFVIHVGLGYGFLREVCGKGGA